MIRIRTARHRVIPLAAALVVFPAVGAAAPAASLKGMAATAHEQASLAAVEMMRKGGNAFDGAAAAAFVLAVVQGYNSGIGGGGFLVGYQSPEKRVFAVDFREVAPKASARDMYLSGGEPAQEKSRDLGLSVGVPGAARGYIEIHKRFGKLPLQAVIAPAIRYAETGFLVTPQYQRVAGVRLECLRSNAESASIFLQRVKGSEKPQVPALGTRIVQKDLAGTLRAMAKSGAAAFYEGKVAQSIVKSVGESGGILSQEDLSSYRVRDRDALIGTYRGHRIATMPPPSAGGIAVLQVLNVLEHTELHTAYRAPFQLHLFAEATKQSYADRAAHLGDPSFAKGPIDRLISKEYGEVLFNRFLGRRAAPAVKVIPFREGDHTSHLSVVDGQGNAAAITTTVNYLFGSCVTAKGTGVLLNDQMDDFAAKPGSPNTYGLVTGEANAVAPGKIPLSSMSPTLVFAKDDPTRVLLVVGSPGGPTIPTTVAQVIVNTIDYSMPVDRALSTPRIHHQYLPDLLMVEPNALEVTTADSLREMGHMLESRPTWGDAHAVFVDPATGVRYGASDSRGEGRAAGE
jgi:gamma-glutamyltranspeptidase/glutathione hydrolase